jgi:beta-galactosidase
MKIISRIISKNKTNLYPNPGTIIKCRRLMRFRLITILILGAFTLSSNIAQQPSLSDKSIIQKSRLVSFDPKAVTIDGERQLLISGEIHYARSPRELWPQLLDYSKAMGLNCVASYVFWGFHEPQKDVYDFSGQRDLGYYLKLCKERNLFVILRIGPYACAEWNFGGYPPYLRDEPGIILRTYNVPYMNRVEKYFEHLAAEIRPYLATNGGPVIMVQVENEYANVAKRYGEDGQRYLKWVVELASRMGIDVQKITCEGGAEGAIECVNGFSIPLERSISHKANKPDQPLIWTELYPAWYDTWGFQHHLRDARNMAFNILNFLGNGGTGWNYYMWHGGTNFGRTSMYLQTTSYDFDAPIDEYGRPSPKGLYLSRLHEAIKSNSKIILEGERTQKVLLSGIRKTTWTSVMGNLTLLVNESGQTLTDGHLTLSARTALLFNSEGKVIFDSQVDFQKIQSETKFSAWKSLVKPLDWKVWNEPLPSERADDVIKNKQPVEQLSLTKDQTDYCWYSAKFTSTIKGQQKIDITYGGDFFYIYLDGKLITQSQPPFMENRGLTMPEDPNHPYIIANALEELKLQGFKHSFVLNDIEAGTHRLDILAVSLGMIKGDWSISGSMNTERKGIWQDVLVNNNVLTEWEMRPFLIGEQLNIYNEQKAVNWTRSDFATPCTWYNTRFQIAPDILNPDADFRIDAKGLGKGMLYINGHMLGRYWLLEGNGYGPDEGWQNPVNDGLSLAPKGQPTQRYYNLPKAWLKENNQITIFEEQTNLPLSVNLEVRRYN